MLQFLDLLLLLFKLLLVFILLSLSFLKLLLEILLVLFFFFLSCRLLRVKSWILSLASHLTSFFYLKSFLFAWFHNLPFRWLIFRWFHFDIYWSWLQIIYFFLMMLNYNLVSLQRGLIKVMFSRVFNFKINFCSNFLVWPLPV